jgi:hypothetical protein
MLLGEAEEGEIPYPYITKCEICWFLFIWGGGGFPDVLNLNINGLNLVNYD